MDFDRGPRTGSRAADKKKTMRTNLKLARPDTCGGRSPLSEMLDHVRRAFGAAPHERRNLRPHQDVDGWSDQAEVAYYEDGRAFRMP